MEFVAGSSPLVLYHYQEAGHSRSAPTSTEVSSALLVTACILDRMPMPAGDQFYLLLCPTKVTREHVDPWSSVLGKQ